MAIFNSYVKLPEGRCLSPFALTSDPLTSCGLLCAPGTIARVGLPTFTTIGPLAQRAAICGGEVVTFNLLHPIGSRQRISRTGQLEGTSTLGTSFCWKKTCFFLQQMCTRRFLQPLGCWSLGYHILYEESPGHTKAPAHLGGIWWWWGEWEGCHVVRVLGALSVWADLTIERWLLAKNLPVNDLLWGVPANWGYHNPLGNLY